MKAQEFCCTAADIVAGDRAVTHGDLRDNFENIAALWNAYLWSEGIGKLSLKQVALMMALLKIARTKTGTYNVDDFVDAIGYAAIAGELAAP